jgi:hypothetical protein
VGHGAGGLRLGQHTTFYDDRKKIGFDKAEGVPGLMTHGTTAMLSEVDDFLISEQSENEYRESAKAIYLLSELYSANGKPGVKWEAEPEVYAGLEIARSLDRLRITVRAEQKIIEACREHIPAVIDGDKSEIEKYDLVQGAALQRALDALQLAPAEPMKKDKDGRNITPKLGGEAKLVQKATGSARFPSQVQPRVIKPLHALAKVASRPARGTYRVARSLLADMYKHKRDGLTYGGTRALSVPRPQLVLAHGIKKRDDGRDNGHGSESGVRLDKGAPMKPEGHSDATWSKLDAAGKPADVYGVLITKAGAAIHAQTKNLGVIAEDSMSAEQVGTVKLTNIGEYLLNIETALGNETNFPMLCTTDNKPNQLVSEGESSATRSRHALRRYWITQQRIASGRFVLRHVDDDNMPADFLTKWLPKGKYEASIEYATNASEAVDATPKQLLDEARAMFTKALAAAAKKADNLVIAGNVNMTVVTMDDIA